MGTKKNHLLEMVLWSTHNICFGYEIKKKLLSTHSYLNMFAVLRNKYTVSIPFFKTSIPLYENSVDPDQLASNGVSHAGPILFTIHTLNQY